MLQLGEFTTQPVLPPGYVWRSYTDYSNVVEFLEKCYGYHITIPVQNTYILAICTDADILVGVITGVVQRMVIGKKNEDMMVIQHLGVRKKMRGKKIASLLLRELARHATGVNAALYPDCKQLSMFSANIYRRGINIKKLIAQNKMTISADIESVVDQHQVLDKTSLNIVPMSDEHITAAWNLLTNYLDRYVMHPVWTEQQFRQLFQNERVKSFVVLDKGEVVDFASYVVSETDVITADVFYFTACKYSSYRILFDLVIVAAQNGADLIVMTDLFEGELLPLFHKAETVTYGSYGMTPTSLKSNAVGYAFNC